MANNILQYYIYNYQFYSINFPLEWAINHYDGTGPLQCKKCQYNGCKDGIFYEYCNDCQLFQYNSNRITTEYCKESSKHLRGKYSSSVAPILESYGVGEY